MLYIMLMTPSWLLHLQGPVMERNPLVSQWTQDQLAMIQNRLDVYKHQLERYLADAEAAIEKRRKTQVRDGRRAAHEPAHTHGPQGI
jgi:hypothetical protein